MNDTRFKLGEIAIMHNCGIVSNENREVQVVELYGWKWCTDNKTNSTKVAKGRIVRDSQGVEWFCRDDQLRKKNPPEDKLAFQNFMGKLLENTLEPA